MSRPTSTIAPASTTIASVAETRPSSDGSRITRSPWSLMRLMTILVAIAQANSDPEDKEAA